MINMSTVQLSVLPKFRENPSLEFLSFLQKSTSITQMLRLRAFLLPYKENAARVFCSIPPDIHEIVAETKLILKNFQRFILFVHRLLTR